MRTTISVPVMGLLVSFIPALALGQDATSEAPATNDNVSPPQQAMPQASMPQVPQPTTAGNEMMGMPPPEAMYEHGYDPMMDADYGQGWGPDFGPDYGWAPYEYGAAYPESHYGYGYGYQEPMPPAMRYSNAPRRGAAYPSDAGAYSGGQPSWRGYQSAPPPTAPQGMSRGGDHHQAMIERLDAIIDRLERIEAALKGRGE